MRNKVERLQWQEKFEQVLGLRSFICKLQIQMKLGKLLKAAINNFLGKKNSGLDQLFGSIPGRKWISLQL